MAKARSPSDLPAWLAAKGGGRRPAGEGALTRIAAGVALLALGFLVGWWWRRPAPPPAVVVAPVCAPTPLCPEHSGSPAPAPRRAATTAHKPKSVTSPALVPLPDAPPLDEDARRSALREFAQKKAPELRTCIAEPDKGPTRQLGAAFEIDDHGAVAAVQVVGAQNVGDRTTRCCRARMKTWQFPRELLRGDESMLVSFVF